MCGLLKQIEVFFNFIKCMCITAYVVGSKQKQINFSLSSHQQKNSEICTYSYPDIILAVKLNRQRLVVVLKQNLYIHNIRDMKVVIDLLDCMAGRQGREDHPRKLCAPLSTTLLLCNMCVSLVKLYSPKFSTEWQKFTFFK